VVDAAAREPSRQIAFHEFIDSFVEKGFVCKAIVVTHIHQDHFGGETVLQKHLLEKFGLRVPILAHKLTAESLAGKIEFDRFIEDEEVFQLQDDGGKTFELKALHAPGHARGHLCFYDEAFGFLLSSDNVIGTGSVIIAPPEGNMIDYLNSLERMKNLPNLKFLCGSHGAAIFGAKDKIESYIAHRLERERKILEAIENDAESVREIVEKVYTDVSPNLWKLAEKSVEAHLEKLKTEEKVLFQGI
jgi:glyoxylase-like metal-dependent hydrolase (beta-lactamase superfamily II)